MQSLKKKRTDNSVATTISVVITLDQTIFKCDLIHLFMDKFIVSQSMKKRVRVTQCKRFPKPGKEIPLGIMYPIGWC